MTPVYIVEHILTGKIFDFFAFTWNDSVRHCIAPYTTVTDIDERYSSELANSYLVRVGEVAEKEE